MRVEIEEELQGMDTTRYFTAEEVARRWACSPRTVYQLAQQGELGCVRWGRRMVRFSAEAVGEFERAHEEGAR